MKKQFLQSQNNFMKTNKLFMFILRQLILQKLEWYVTGDL